MKIKYLLLLPCKKWLHCEFSGYSLVNKIKQNITNIIFFWNGITIQFGVWKKTQLAWRGNEGKKIYLKHVLTKVSIYTATKSFSILLSMIIVIINQKEKEMKASSAQPEEI